MHKSIVFLSIAFLVSRVIVDSKNSYVVAQTRTGINNGDLSVSKQSGEDDKLTVTDQKGFYGTGSRVATSSLEDPSGANFDPDANALSGGRRYNNQDANVLVYYGAAPRPSIFTRGNYGFGTRNSPHNYRAINEYYNALARSLATNGGYGPGPGSNQYYISNVPLSGAYPLLDLMDSRKTSDTDRTMAEAQFVRGSRDSAAAYASRFANIAKNMVSLVSPHENNQDDYAKGAKMAAAYAANTAAKMAASILANAHTDEGTEIKNNDGMPVYRPYEPQALGARSARITDNIGDYSTADYDSMQTSGLL